MTQSVPVAELYEMAYGFNIGVVIKTILGKILESVVLLIFCTDSKSLYDCLVKLGIIQEKQITIDVMSLC